MKHSHGGDALHKGMQEGSRSMAKEIAKGSVVGAIVHTGGKLVSKLTKHPLITIGVGVAAGYIIYKYRKEIVSGTNKAVGAGKDFVQQQKENLEDIVAESREGK